MKAIKNNVKIIMVVAGLDISIMLCACLSWYAFFLLPMHWFVSKDRDPEAYYVSQMETRYMLSGSIYRGTVSEMLKDIEKSLTARGVPVFFYYG